LCYLNLQYLGKKVGARNPQK